jgi:uncharacterized protein (TIGR03437 family)
LSILVADLSAQPTPRTPRGIYAKVNIASEIKQQQKSNPAITPSQMSAYFNQLFEDLLANPAVSGLSLQVHWDTVNPNPLSNANPYDWTYIDDAFNQASAWNLRNPAGAPMTIQLIVTPGFQTPQWVLDQIPSCDGLFQSPPQSPPNTCGKVTFKGFGEEADNTELPLPWSAVYKSSWKTFLTALEARFGSNPTLVSIAVGGPTAASEEMILPNNGNTPAQFGGIMPNQMWQQLLAFHYTGMPAYQKSDQAFIDEWSAAIDMYGQLFSGVTLVLTTGSGLPNFAGGSFTVPDAFAADCGRPDMDCAAEATIIAHFADPATGGANAKATQTSGVKAARTSLLNLGLASVKRLARNTAQLMAPSAQILGGAQFDTSFSNNSVTEGCTAKFPPDASDTPAGCNVPASCSANACVPVACIPQACLAPGVAASSLASFKTFGNVPPSDLISPEQALYNVLNFCFEGTAAASFFGAASGAAPLNYLQIYSADIQYARDSFNMPAQVFDGSGAVVSRSAQDLLNLASQKLLTMAEPAVVVSAGGIVIHGGTTPAVSPGSLVDVYGTNLANQSLLAPLSPALPLALGGVKVLVDNAAAPLIYISPLQIIFQAPFETAIGTASIVVVSNGLTSAPAAMTVKDAAPTILSYGVNRAIAINPDGSLNGPNSGARPGTVLLVYLIGSGPLDHPVATGAPSPSSPLSQETLLTTASIGGAVAQVQFAGMAPGFVGLVQVNLVVPDLAPGDYPLQVTIGGMGSNQQLLTVSR